MILDAIASVIADAYMWLVGMREPAEVTSSDLTLIMMLLALLGIPALVMVSNWRAAQRRREETRRLRALLSADDQGGSLLNTLSGVMILGVLVWIVMRVTFW